MATRNLTLEKNAIDVFNKERQRLPSSSEDWGQVHKIAYPTINDLPEELKNESTLSYYQATGGSSAGPPAGSTITPPTGNPLSQTQEGSQLGGLESNKNAAQARVVELGSGNEALRVLQEAIRTKSGTAQAPIGESEIFKQAGVGGIGALGSSLAARGAEIQTNFANFQNIISQMSGTYKDMASTALFTYQEAAKAYDNEIVRLQKIEDDARNYEQQIDLINKQFQNSVALEKLRASTPSVEQRVEGWKGGYTFDDKGNPVADISQASADDVANAILTVESGGNFNAAGGSGESGRFQFMPDTWNIISQQYAQAMGLNQSLSMTPENEDKVARWKIGQLLESGNSPEEVALIWNTSLGGAEKPFVRKGVNDKGVSYDSGAYANKVVNTLRKQAQASGSSGAGSDILAQAINASSGLSVNAQKTNKALVEQYLKNGDVEAAQRQVEIMAYNAMGSTEKSNFDETENAVANLKYAAELLNSKDFTVGPYKALAESAKPYSLIQSDPAYAEFRVFTDIGQAQIRRAFFGTAVTDAEQKAAAGMLAKPEDDITLLKVKLNTLPKIMEFANDAKIARITGAPTPKLADYISVQDTVPSPEGVSSNNNDPMGIR